MFLNIYKKFFYLKIKLRIFYWKRLFGSFGLGSKVFGKIIVYNPENVNIGSCSTLNYGVFLNARDKIVIGDNVHISPYVIINTGYLNYKMIGSSRTHLKGSVVIKNGAWIGSNVIINPGVVIGENSVIGAGAVVTKDIPNDSVAVGVPAEVKKKIND